MWKEREAWVKLLLCLTEVTGARAAELLRRHSATISQVCGKEQNQILSELLNKFENRVEPLRDLIKEKEKLLLVALLISPKGWPIAVELLTKYYQSLEEALNKVYESNQKRCSYQVDVAQSNKPGPSIGRAC